ncbi:MAG: rhomboid family intramembrane serine protease [Flavobacteriales bacterium]|jgi:membrane associated rhomboid family serine protease|nr:rhomboid family intramembrane serine protease [Flavobacteriales bacterium]
MRDVVGNIKALYNRGGMFLKLLYVNVAIYVVLNIFIGGLFQLDLIHWFSFDSNLLSNINKPWSLFTYMFIHGGTRHILFNMLVLFFVGSMFEHYFGKKKVLSTYIIGGLAGAVLFLITQNIFPLLINSGPSTLLGASASVMAIFVGLAAYKPNLEVAVFGVFNVKLYILALLYVGVDLLSVGNLDGVAHFAHLGGAAWGYYMGSQLKNGKDVSMWFDKAIGNLSGIFKRKPKMKVSYSNNPKPPRDDYEYNAKKQSDQQKLDAILDKIKVGGYEALSKKEKEFLNNF